MVRDQLPRLGKRELICLLLFNCNYVVSIRRGFLFLWVLGMGYVIVLWHSLSLPYDYFREKLDRKGVPFVERLLSHHHYMWRTIIIAELANQMYKPSFAFLRFIKMNLVLRVFYYDQGSLPYLRCSTG